MDARMLDLLTMKHGQDGMPVPFRLEYLCKDGSIMKEDNVVCVRRNKENGTRDIMLLNTKDNSDYAKAHGLDRAQVRTIRDCLIMRVNDYKIIMS